MQRAYDAGNVPLDPEEVFDIKKQMAYEAFERLFCPDGLNAARNELSGLKEKMRKGRPDGRDPLRREYLTTHRTIEESDLDEVRMWRNLAHDAKGAEMDEERYQLIMANIANGLMGERQGMVEIRAEQGTALRKLRERTRDLLFYMNDFVINVQTTGALMTDAERKDVAEKWEEYDRFQRAVEAFRERYNSLKSFKAKSEMRAQFPELAEFL